MPYILPESRLAAEFEKVAAHCRGTGEPAFLTREGFGDLVLLSQAGYEQLRSRLERAENTLAVLARRAAAAAVRPAAAEDDAKPDAGEAEEPGKEAKEGDTPPAAAAAQEDDGGTGVLRRDLEDVKYDFKQELRRLGGEKLSR